MNFPRLAIETESDIWSIRVSLIILSADGPVGVLFLAPAFYDSQYKHTDRGKDLR